MIKLLLSVSTVRKIAFKLESKGPKPRKGYAMKAPRVTRGFFFFFRAGGGGVVAAAVDSLWFRVWDLGF